MNAGVVCGFLMLQSNGSFGLLKPQNSAIKHCNYIVSTMFNREIS